jgi:hypothetical protein
MRRRVLVLAGVFALVAGLVGVALVGQAPTRATHRWVLNSKNVPQPIARTAEQRENYAIRFALGRLTPEARAALYRRKIQGAIDSGMLTPAEVVVVEPILGLLTKGRLYRMTNAEREATVATHWAPARKVLGSVKYRTLFAMVPPKDWVQGYVAVLLDVPMPTATCTPVPGGPSADGIAMPPPEQGLCECREDDGEHCWPGHEYCCSNHETCPECTFTWPSGVDSCDPVNAFPCTHLCKTMGADAPSPAPRPVPHAPASR